MRSKFSKAGMLEALQQRADRIRAAHGFDPKNGTAQLKGELATQEAAVACGEFRACLKIISQIEDASIIN